MKARDAPWTVENSPTIVGKISTEAPPTGIRASKPAKRSKQKAKAPKERRRARPPKVSGYGWRRDGAGWELRKTVYIETGTGTRKRKRPYVAHLSKSAFAEMKRQHRGAALERAIAAWIEDHDRP